MKDIVNKFVNYEDQNHAMFKYINELRDELEQLNK